MKKILVNLIFITGVAVTALSQGPYDLKVVPEAIKNKASVIVHLESAQYEVENLEKASLSVHRIFTVVNEDGKKELFFSQGTSRYRSLEDVEIKVYDANGKQTGKYKKKDMVTQAAGDGLIDDGNITYFSIASSTYPVTV